LIYGQGWQENSAEKKGNDDVAYWLSRSPIERLRALDEMRRMYINAYVAPGKRKFSRVYRIVKLKRR
jgi:hypothetical protein